MYDGEDDLIFGWFANESVEIINNIIFDEFDDTYVEIKQSNFYTCKKEYREIINEAMFNITYQLE